MLVQNDENLRWAPFQAHPVDQFLAECAAILHLAQHGYNCLFLTLMLVTAVRAAFNVIGCIVPQGLPALELTLVDLGRGSDDEGKDSDGNGHGSHATHL